MELMGKNFGEDMSLSKAAEKAGRNPDVQDTLDIFQNGLRERITGGRKGTKALASTIRYFRADNGARLFFRRVGDTFEVLGKADKSNEDVVINTLYRLYRK